MKIIEKCDTRQDTSLQHKHKEITHIGCRRTIKNTRSFTVQYKVFHLLGEKFLSARQGYGGKKEASQQGQRNGIVRAGRVGDRCPLKAGINFLHSMKINQLQTISVRLCRTSLVLPKKEQQRLRKQPLLSLRTKAPMIWKSSVRS